MGGPFNRLGINYDWDTLTREVFLFREQTRSNKSNKRGPITTPGSCQPFKRKIWANLVPALASRKWVETKLVVLRGFFGRVVRYVR